MLRCERQHRFGRDLVRRRRWASCQVRSDAERAHVLDVVDRALCVLQRGRDFGVVGLWRVELVAALMSRSLGGVPLFMGPGCAADGATRTHAPGLSPLGRRPAGDLPGVADLTRTTVLVGDRQALRGTTAAPAKRRDWLRSRGRASRPR